ncbi:MAG: aminotransferase class III-fold pyridoxal phosphate-dependent enzyme [Hyphomicrobiaceae bacterium]|nr:aminotransferase class III-fold pyridoxal phosphate-dependent enzyme [Hyphomicrobiaceae bacterium]
MDDADLSDAYWMPFTANREFRRRPRMIVGASGLQYRTNDGRTVLDATSGLYCVNAGHCREPIVAAIAAAASRLDYAPAFQFGHPDVFRLAERLAALAPGDLDHVFFACSGSEAVETAMKIALAYHKSRGEGSRTRFVGRERGYHGVSLAGLSVGGIPANRKAFGAVLHDADHLRTTYDRGRQAFSVGEPEWGCELADELERVIALHDASSIAAVVIEPVAGSTGCLPPPKEYLERIREITARHGILLILDEVITAFGRLGYAFAAERYGFVPDMIAFAKGVTNGAVPLSGTIVRAGIHEALMRGPRHLPEFYHGYTYSGHPLGVAAALATLDVYRDEGLFERANGLEEEFAQMMLSLRRHPAVLDIRPIGLMCGIDLEAGKDGMGTRGYELMARAFHDCDLYVRVVADTVILAPPLIATSNDLDDIRARLGRAISAVC